MPITVSLRNIAGKLETLPDESYFYLNRETGELRIILREEASLAEEETDLDKVREWQRELVVKAREVLDSPDWLQLPTKFDIHEWEIMDKFALSLENEYLQNQLRNTIRKTGAFRRFKATSSGSVECVQDSRCGTNHRQMARRSRNCLSLRKVRGSSDLSHTGFD